MPRPAGPTPAHRPGAVPVQRSPGSVVSRATQAGRQAENGEPFSVTSSVTRLTGGL